MSAKEDCFKEAADAYQEATGKDLGLEHKVPWRQNIDKSWSRETRGFWAGVHSMLKYIRRKGHSDSVVQIRVPDITMNTTRGPLVIDLKFTRADGSVDTWRNTPGKGNGKTQKHDYNKINEQTEPDAKNLKLDPTTCGCSKRGSQPYYVYEPALGYNHQLYFVPAPPLLGGPALPALTPLPVIS